VVFFFDRMNERFYRLVHRFKGYLGWMTSYFHLREKDSMQDANRMRLFAEAKALTALVAVLTEACAASDANNSNLAPSSALASLAESFAGVSKIEYASSGEPVPVRFVEKVGFWLHQTLVTALKNGAEGPFRLEWHGGERQISVSLSEDRVDWSAILADATIPGELARTYSADLSGRSRVEGQTLIVVFPLPSASMARV
ncbi:MAG: hypothetical protein RMM53_11665, partial [Bacteroidia bacterium]|nr:hypothetical protein [Bacteroidia bacterium]MDW8334864.1 hypothetical protein [Bacteroidia bacterium]